MQQVVLFSNDFSKQSAELLKKELNKIEKLVESNELPNTEEYDKPPYQPIRIDLSEPPKKLKEIIERYKGLNLGLPPEWFHYADRLEVTILQKNIPVEGDPSSLLLMPNDGTPVRLIVNDDYLTNNILSVFFVTNINYGDPDSVLAFEQNCDQKLVQIQSNINLLNKEIETFNETCKASFHNKTRELKKLQEVK